jgi:hypothetical protein
MRSLLLTFAWLLSLCVVDGGAALSQQPARIYRIGWLWTGEQGADIPIEKWTGNAASLIEELRSKGYVLGKNLLIEMRSAQGDVSRLPALAEALVATQLGD